MEKKNNQKQLDVIQDTFFTEQRARIIDMKTPDEYIDELNY